MKLGANSLLFGAWDMETAFKYLKMAGYDGIEMSAIDVDEPALGLEPLAGMCAGELCGCRKNTTWNCWRWSNPRAIPDLMERAMQAAVETGIPIINVGPGGKSDDESTYPQVLDELGALVQRAEHYGVMLCVKGACQQLCLQYADQPQDFE